MRRICQGDSQAFAELTHRHGLLFYRVAYRIVGQRDDAEDVVQAAFLKLWENPTAWKPDRNAQFTTWFYRVVTNQALGQVRQRTKGDDSALDALPDTRPTAEDRHADHDRHRALSAALDTLTRAQRSALVLCVYEGMTNQQAADVMGIRLKALQALLVRAKQRLRRHVHDGEGKGYGT